MTVASKVYSGSVGAAMGAVWSTEPRRFDYAPVYGLREALKALVERIDGVDAVYLLTSGQRYAHASDKVFFVLGTHDLHRDERIVRVMLQFERVDYDLVPAASAGMVPCAAVRIE